jgi:hypothetical protein
MDTGLSGIALTARPAPAQDGVRTAADREATRSPGPHGGGPASGGRPNRSGCPDRGGANRSYAQQCEVNHTVGQNTPSASFPSVSPSSSSPNAAL